jgi:hypothetical protein
MDDETRKKLDEWNKLVGNNSLQAKEPADTPSAPLLTPTEQKPTTGEEAAPTISPLKEAQAKKEKEHKSLLKKIRTYETDAAENIRKKKTSLSSMVIAEKKRAEKEAEYDEKEEHHTSKAVFSVIFSIILIAGGIGVLGAWFYFSYDQDDAPDNPFSATFLEANREETILLEDLSTSNLPKEIENIKSSLTLGRGEVYVPIFSKSVPGELPEDEGLVVALSSREFLELLSVRAPLSLYRSLDPKFVMGIWQGNKKEVFLVLKTTFFQNAFASMLSWEPFLAEDLSFITRDVELASIVPNETISNPSATSTSTTSPATETPSEVIAVEGNFVERFEDEVFFNHDARVLRDSRGNIKLLYSFPNEETLLITGSSEAMESILERLNTARFEG